MTTTTRTVSFATLPLDDLGLTGHREIHQVQQAVKEILRDHLESRDGQIIKSLDDGFLLVFESATESVLWANDVQEAVSQTGFDEVEGFNGLKISLHTGEVALDHEGDVHGQPVSTAARLMKLAVPGQIIISETTVEAADEPVISRNYHYLERRGEEQLKGLPHGIDIYSSGLKSLDDIPGQSKEPLEPLGSNKVHLTKSLPAPLPSSSIALIAVVLLVTAGLGLYFYYQNVTELSSNPDAGEQRTRTKQAPAREPVPVADRIDQLTSYGDGAGFDGLSLNHRTQVESYTANQTSSRGQEYDSEVTLNLQEQRYRNGLRYIGYRLDRMEGPIPFHQQSFEQWFDKNIPYKPLLTSPHGEPLQYIRTPGIEPDYTLNYQDDRGRLWMSYVGGVTRHYGVTPHVAFRRAGQPLVELSTNQYFNRNPWESPVALIVARAMRSQVDADVALANYPSLRGSLSRGSVTAELIRRIYPWDNGVVVLEMSPRTFYKGVEENCSPPGVYVAVGMETYREGLWLPEASQWLHEMDTIRVAMSEDVGDWTKNESDRHKVFRQQEVVERSDRSVQELVIETLSQEKTDSKLLDFSADKKPPLKKLCQTRL